MDIYFKSCYIYTHTQVENVSCMVEQLVATAASQPKGPEFNSQLEPFCVEFTCSPKITLKVFFSYLNPTNY